jgi:uncharacterized membrane protein
MSVENKRKLATIVYYTLAVMTIIFAGFFGYALVVRNVAMWAKVVYFIWIAVVIGAVVFDIICSSNNNGKTLLGLVVYVLSILAVIMAAILYFMNVTRTGIVLNFFNVFLSVSLLSLITTGFLIATWCVGERLVENRTAAKEIKVQQN